MDKYKEALAFIHGRTQFKKIPTLKRMQDFCKRLGDPQQKLKMIHITGTNGKGSTTAFLRQILMAQGFNVGTFTSPFIIKFNDRICLNGNMISDDELVELVEEIRPVVAQMDKDWHDKGGGPTEFEIDTALMFLYFNKVDVDYVIVEVGLGGTYDATNVITPLVSVITEVAADHLKYLGPTLKDVARNKAGIIKDNVPVVVGQLPADVMPVVQQKALQMNAPLYALGTAIKVEPHASSQWGEAFDYHFKNYHQQNLHLNMMGAYQISNAALALSAAILLGQIAGWQLRLQDVKHALAQTSWPGRFEVVNQEPLIILDGAHNLDAIVKLTQTLRERFKGRQLHLIIAILKDKQPFEMVHELLKLPHVELTLTKFASPRPLADIKAIKQKYPQVKVADQWQSAFVNEVRSMDSDDILIFGGSLYFISEVRHYFKDDLKEE